MSNEIRVNRAEINRLTKAIAAEEQNINLAFQRIGQPYFAAHRNEPEESQAADVRTVQEALQRAKQIKDQINGGCLQGDGVFVERCSVFDLVDHGADPVVFADNVAYGFKFVSHSFSLW